MIFECFFSCFGYRIGSIRFPTDKAFMDFDKAVLLQIDEMRGEIAIRKLQQLLEVIETDLLIHQQDAHHTHSDATIEYLV